MKRILAAILCGAMLLATTACSNEPSQQSSSQSTGQSTSQSSDSKPQDNSPYKIACIAPLTGANAEHGASYKNAIEYMLKKINDNGGIDGRQIVCEYFDDKGDSKETVTCASLVVEDKDILACFGPFSSTCAIAAAPTFEEAGIALFAPSSSHADFTSLGDYMVRGCNTSEIQQRFYAKFLRNFYKAQNVVFLYLNDDAGNSSKDYFTQYFEELGGKVVKAEPYENGQKDFNATLTTLKTLNPEVLIVYGGYADVATVVNQAKNLEIKAPIMTFGAAQQQGLIDVVGKNGEDILIMTALDLDADTAALKEFSEGFMKAYDVKNINSHVLNMYDGVQSFVDALTKNGPDRAKIAAYMRDCTVEGLCGSYNVVKGDPDKPMGVITIQDGKFVPYRTVNPAYTGDVG